VFALRLQERYYDPTFHALKTYFFFDDAIICLGSNIETRDAARPTETTLFQVWMADPATPVVVNGESVTDLPYSWRGAAGRAATLMDPCGNGYVLPDAGSARLQRCLQESKDAWNRKANAGFFSTCWWDHGHAPTDDGYGGQRYEYALLVQTTPGQLAAFAADPPYRVLQQDHQAHILHHQAHGTMAYALFETDWVVPHGILCRTDTPVLAMVKSRPQGITLSIADPDLRLPRRRNFGYLDEEALRTPCKASVARLELRGGWRLESPNPAVCEIGRAGGVTRLAVQCRAGLTVELRLTEEEPTRRP
jgi:chondroitin-sulfate-ABC endolyase/exolyase